MTPEQMAAFVAEWEPKGPWVVDECDNPIGWCVIWPAGAGDKWDVTVGAHYVLEPQAYHIAATLNWLESLEVEE
jgi:hypothetical protein